MNIQKKKMIRKISIIVLSIGILLGLLTIQNEAANQTNSANNTQNNKSTTNTTAGKSSNANLGNLGIKPHDFSGFKAATTSYDVTIPENTESIEVYAKAQSEKAKVSGTGKKKLEKGLNKIDIVVTAEDGTSKTYTLNITRGTKQEGNVTNVEKAKGLSTLKINNSNLSPEFKTDIHEYTAKYTGEDTKLNIETIPTSENYSVKVTGNENLQEGENNITVVVSEENGNNVATYQIKVNKVPSNGTATSREEMKKKKQEQKTIIGTIVILVCIITIIVMIQKRNKYLRKEFSKVKNNQKEENKQEYSNPLNNEENKQEYSNPLNDEENKQEYSNPLNKEENRQEYAEPLNNEENRPEFTTPVNKEENNNYDHKDKYEEDEIEKMPKDEIRERFLNNFTSKMDTDFDEGYQDSRKRGKHKGKRFK